MQWIMDKVIISRRLNVVRYCSVHKLSTNESFCETIKVFRELFKNNVTSTTTYLVK